MESGHPVSEEPFEVAFDLHGSFDGPKKGRIRAMEKVSFSLCCSCTHFEIHFSLSLTNAAILFFNH